ncbi:hypothetical protein RRF57_008114 [Xylaria bambusicola]|uniref:Uncharacterized protein n=1 Tax=Xylaria bambusicola TaxID=326684 RepID=A0AAN7UH82_9PEZI
MAPARVWNNSVEHTRRNVSLSPDATASDICTCSALAVGMLEPLFERKRGSPMSLCGSETKYMPASEAQARKRFWARRYTICANFQGEAGQRHIGGGTMVTVVMENAGS